jgi:hypothetical protein
MAQVDRRTAGEGNFLTREFKLINIATLANADADAGNAALLAAVEAVETVASISAIGAFSAGTDTEVNMLIEGMDFSAGTGAGGYADAYVGGTQTWLEYLATLTGETVTEVAF